MSQVYNHQTLFYIDPPYVHSTRMCRHDNYQHEMTDLQHQCLTSQLSTIKGMAIVSGYRSDLYDESFQGWKRVDKKARTLAGYATECLWLSPRIPRRRKQ